MATIFRDYVGPLMGNFINNTSLYNTFEKAWGKEAAPGHFDYSLVWYEQGWFREDYVFKRFLSKLGMSVDKLKEEDYDEIKRVFFILNPGKTPSPDYASSMTEITPTDLATKLDSVLNIGDKVNVMTIYGGETQQFVDEHADEWIFEGTGQEQIIVSTSLNTDTIRDVLLADRWRYYCNIRESEDSNTSQYTDYAGGPDEFDYLNGTFPVKTTASTTPPCYTFIEKGTDSVFTREDEDVKYFTLAMLDASESCFKLTRNTDGTPKLIDRGSSTYLPGVIDDDRPVFDEDGSLIIYDSNTIDTIEGGAVTKYTFGYEYEYIGASSSDSLVTNIIEKVPLIFPKDVPYNNDIQNTIQKTTIAALYEPVVEFDEDPENLGVFIPVDGTGGWYPYFNMIGNKWYLNRDKAAAMKKYEFASMISECLDTDYKAESASFFEKLFTVVLVIVAVVIAWFAPYLLGVASGGLAAFSVGVGMFSLVLSIGTLVLSQMGLSAQSLVKIVGAVAQITGIVAMVTGVMASVQAAFNKAALAAADAGTISAPTQYTAGMFVTDFAKNMLSNIKSAITGGVEGIFNLFTDTQSVLLGTGKQVSDLGVTGWLGRLSNGMKMYNKFFDDKSGSVETPNQEQMEKRDFQHPEQMYQVQERMIYEPDALEKIDILKEQQNGGRKTEELMQRIA